MIAPVDHLRKRFASTSSEQASSIFPYFFLILFVSLLIAMPGCGGGGGGGGGTPSNGGAENGDGNTGAGSGGDDPVQQGAAPTILTQPQAVFADAGDSASFSVSASGSGVLQYQWMRNGANIDGATQATYRLEHITDADHASLFSVRVSNSFGGVVSNYASLTIYFSPVVADSPDAQTVVAGTSATLSAVAHGKPPLKFQWRKYRVSIPGATSATYITPPLTPGDSGANFDVVVMNDYGVETSAPASITVTPLASDVTIATQPQAIAVNEGDIATFSVSVNGTGPFMYQWLRNGIAIPGAYEPIYRFTASRLNDGNQFSVNVSNTVGTAVSSFASLAVTPGAISLLAGGLGGSGINDGVADQARFSCPTDIAMDAAGNLYVTTEYGVRKIRPDQTVSTFVGGTTFAIGSTDGVGTNARFHGAAAVAIDSFQNLYVVDGGNSTIRQITPSGTVSTFAGSAGIIGALDGPAPFAQFNLTEPLVTDCINSGIAIDQSNNIYIADTYNHTIRKITFLGMVSTIAGAAGQAGFSDGNGSAARFNKPRGLAFDHQGNLLVVDSANRRVRKVNASGQVTTLSETFLPISHFGMIADIAVDTNGSIFVSENRGSIWKSDDGDKFYPVSGNSYFSWLSVDGVGADAEFPHARGIYADSLGEVYAIDDTSVRKLRANYRVGTIAGGNISPVISYPPEARFTTSSPTDIVIDSAGNLYLGMYTAIFQLSSSGSLAVWAGSTQENGSDDGSRLNARFLSISNLTIDSVGNIYVSDSAAHTIRKISPNGIVSTVAGKSGQIGSADGQGSVARFNAPKGMGVDNAGNLYVADSNNKTVRKISPSGAVSTLAGVAGAVGLTDGTGADARFFDPTQVAVDSANNVYLLDGKSPFPLRKITPAGVVTAIGMSGGLTPADGIGSAVRFALPEALTADNMGNVYVAELGSIRKVEANGTVSTVVGNIAFRGVRLGALPGALNHPRAMTSKSGTSGPTLYIVDESALLSVQLP